MKKQYIAPTMEVFEMEGNEMLCASAVRVGLYGEDAVHVDDDDQYGDAL